MRLRAGRHSNLAARHAPPELIYSNAALQWVGGHAALFPRLVSLLAPGGVLAVQMPAMHDAPLRQLQQDGGGIRRRGREELRDVPMVARPILIDGLTTGTCCARIIASLDIWETTYLHVLTGEDAVVQWASGSSLRPFLDRLPEALRAAFGVAYAEALRPHYPRRADGTTLLPFRRLFMVARR